MFVLLFRRLHDWNSGKILYFRKCFNSYKFKIRSLRVILRDLANSSVSTKLLRMNMKRKSNTNVVGVPKVINFWRSFKPVFAGLAREFYDPATDSTFEIQKMTCAWNTSWEVDREGDCVCKRYNLKTFILEREWTLGLSGVACIQPPVAPAGTFMTIDNYLGLSPVDINTTYAFNSNLTYGCERYNKTKKHYYEHDTKIISFNFPGEWNLKQL